MKRSSSPSRAGTRASRSLPREQLLARALRLDRHCAAGLGGETAAADFRGQRRFVDAAGRERGLRQVDAVLRRSPRRCPAGSWRAAGRCRSHRKRPDWPGVAASNSSSISRPDRIGRAPAVVVDRRGVAHSASPAGPAGRRRAGRGSGASSGRDARTCCSQPVAPPARRRSRRPRQRRSARCNACKARVARCRRRHRPRRQCRRHGGQSDRSPGPPGAAVAAPARSRPGKFS